MSPKRLDEESEPLEYHAVANSVAILDEPVAPVFVEKCAEQLHNVPDAAPNRWIGQDVDYGPGAIGDLNLAVMPPDLRSAPDGVGRYVRDEVFVFE